MVEEENRVNGEMAPQEDAAKVPLTEANEGPMVGV